MVASWKFIDNKGTFELPNPQRSNHLYFPLVNEAGLMSSVSPLLHGDIKTGQHSFLTPPVSVYDLENSRAGRNFWLSIEGTGSWSATGISAKQVAQNFTDQENDEVDLRAGFLWHQVNRENKTIGLRAEITTFVPASADTVELMSVRITNISTHPVQFAPTASIPIFGRSADNLRDHRHVTSLLHQIVCHKYGIVVRPTLSFDERGHHPNQLNYLVVGVESNGTPPLGFFPVAEHFTGEGGSLDWPEAAIRLLRNCAHAGDTFEGEEAVGALRFTDTILAPGQSCGYILILGISTDVDAASRFILTYGSPDKFNLWLDKTKDYWHGKIANLTFSTNDQQHNQWLKWVSIQPTLRRLFGNSFLPYHDYGRGGRGWRDLWQDILALLILETGQVDHLLFENFAGVRLDGSNATIIGSQPGDFKADRNNIPRVWMDHGAWPLLTTRLYIDQSGDLEFLLRNQVYFKDHVAERAQSVDMAWTPAQGTQQRTHSGEIYQGTILEHLLVQHLTVFFNVGEHNHIRLEGADWNDGMDMAAQRGESVAFTAMYGSNLRILGQLVKELQNRGLEQVELAAELLPLVDTLQNKVDYLSIIEKQAHLKTYFSAVTHTISGKKVPIRLADLATDLFAKADWITNHIRYNEWISNGEGHGWFNGYYDNSGNRLEGYHPLGVRMTLTGQVFTLMGGIATKAQAEQMIRAVDDYLFDASVGGYRLNTNFYDVLLDMGRCFGFAFGHKENGAMFSHMAVMYAYALYLRGYPRQAYRTLDSIYRQSANFEVSRMYPGIPEYFTPRGRGVYPYLTGSASWYLLTLLNQSFGVRGVLGDLVLSPKLVLEQFDSERKASVCTWFAGRQIVVIYHNPEQLEYGDYRIGSARLNNLELTHNFSADECQIARRMITDLDATKKHQLDIWLAHQ